MNIVLFPSAFHPSLGGVEELTRQLAIEYRRLGHRVLVVTNRWPRDLPMQEAVEGTDVLRLPLRTPGECVKSRVTYRLTTALVARRLRRALQAFAADVIHIQCVAPGSIYAVDAARHLGVPLVVTLQGELTMDATRLYQRSEHARGVLRTCLVAAAAITACSGHTLAEAEAFFERPFGNRGRVIHNGVRLSDFEEIAPHRRGRPYVLAIGRHVMQKGFDVLLQAWAQLGKTGRDGHELVIAGDGPERASLEALARELALSESVAFVGRADRAATAALYAGATIVAVPSRHEPFGIVNLEAMASKRPVIASRVGGIPEIVTDGEAGLLVPGGEVEPLAAAIGGLLGDITSCRAMGAAGRARAAASDWSRVAGLYLQTYESIGASALRIGPGDSGGGMR